MQAHFPFSRLSSHRFSVKPWLSCSSSRAFTRYCRTDVMLALLLTSLAFVGLPVFSLSMKLAIKAEWIEMKPASVIEPKRSGHVAFHVQERNFVFGGYAEDGDMNRYVTNDLWEWKDKGWTEQTQSEQVPGPRLVSAAVVLNGSPYLLGGWDPQSQGTGGIILDTVHKLNIQTGEWTVLSTVLPDGPTSRHIALKFQDLKAFIHNHRCTDHVWILNAETDSFIKQPTTGTAPSSRGLHCATMASDHVAVLFGGAAKEGVMSNEAFLLDTTTWKWTRVELDDGPCPTPRAGASLCCYRDDCVILFGGAEATETGLHPRGDVWALQFNADSGKGQWELLLPDDNDTGPEPRNAATLSPIQPLNDNGKSFLLTGGWAPFRKTWNDCFVLCVSENET